MNVIRLRAAATIGRLATAAKKIVLLSSQRARLIRSTSSGLYRLWIECILGRQAARKLMRVKGYEVQIEALSNEDGGFVASIQELPGLELIGNTPEEAAAGIPAAIESWCAMARKLGRKVPKPELAHA